MNDSSREISRIMYSQSLIMTKINLFRMIQDTWGAEGLCAIIIHSLDIYMHTFENSPCTISTVELTTTMTMATNIQRFRVKPFHGFSTLLKDSTGNMRLYFTVEWSNTEMECDTLNTVNKTTKICHLNSNLADFF